MNKIIQTKEKSDRKRNNKFRKWWRKNDYKVLRVILFPFWISVILQDRHKNKQYNQMKFSTELCKKYLDKVMPFMVSKYCDDAKEFLISDADDMGEIEFSDFHGSLISKKYRKIEMYFAKFYDPLKGYILEDYQIKGYQKMVLTNWTHWEQAMKKFNWGGTPYHSDYRKGVVFYIENENQEC